MPEVNFSQWTRKEIEDQIIDGEDLTLLYRLDVHLERKKSSLFFDIHRSHQENEKMKLKSDLSWSQNMHDLCKKQEENLKEGNAIFNWRFRVKAQEILPESTYNQIAESAKGK